MRILIIAPRKEKSNAYLRFLKAAMEQIAKEKGVALIEKEKEVLNNNSFIYFKTVDISKFNAWWIYYVKLPWKAKKIRANKIITLTGTAIASSTPQTIICSWPVQKSEFFWQQLAHKKLKQSIDKSIAVYTYIPDKINLSPKMNHLHPFVLEKKISISDVERIQLKNEHANTFEFFYASFGKINEASIVFLLKAFSKFKKWQLSNMQLLIEGSMDDFPAVKLASYKYRRDIHFIQNSNDEVKAAAYASIHITNDETDVIPILKSLQLSVPIVVSTTVFTESALADAILVFDNTNSESLGAQMITIYRDEARRSQLIGLGKQVMEQYDVAKAKEALWQLLS